MPRAAGHPQPNRQQQDKSVVPAGIFLTYNTGIPYLGCDSFSLDFGPYSDASDLWRRIWTSFHKHLWRTFYTPGTKRTLEIQK